MAVTIMVVAEMVAMVGGGGLGGKERDKREHLIFIQHLLCAMLKHAEYFSRL